mgnify:CR=1 FL=1
MQESKTTALFEKAPISEAVLKNALPAMAAMLMTLIYNLADTFFVGQTHDAFQVAAVSLAMPVFLIFMAVGMVFGMGGTSVISRALGQKRNNYAKKVCSFCMWGSVITGITMAIFFLIFMDKILILVGASQDTLNYAKSYLTIVSFGGPFVLISSAFSNIIRAEGKSKEAMMGQVLGNLLNVVLDPIMILLLGWNITGAAVATVIGNLFGGCYYICYFVQGKSSLSISTKELKQEGNVFAPVFSIGIPAALGSLLMSVSQIVINSQLSTYGDMAVAGMGVAMKVVTITGMICIGLGQGVQPLLGYCVGAKLWERFKKAFRFSILFALALGATLTAISYLFTNQIVHMFLTDPDAYSYAVEFSRILLTTSFLFGVFYVLVNTLQAMGAATSALIINLSRQGIIFIPALFILHAMIGINGLIWAQPVADILSIIFALILYRCVSQKMMIANGLEN